MTVGVGASCFVDGARLARSKPLRRFVWAPLATSLAGLRPSKKHERPTAREMQPDCKH